MSDEKEKLLEQLEAKVTAHDADVSDLGIVVKSDYEETQNRIEELEAENDRLEDEMEDLQAEVEVAKMAYAEDLEEYSLLSAEELAEERPLSDLKERHEALREEDKVDELGAGPDPKSGDVEEGGTPDEPGSSGPDLDRQEKRELAQFMAPGGDLDQLGFDWSRADGEQYVEELRARKEEMEAQATGSPIKQHAVDEYEEMLADLTGE